MSHKAKAIRMALLDMPTRDLQAVAVRAAGDTCDV